MERIILEVDESLARKWEEASKTKRNKVTAFISQVLNLEDEDLPVATPTNYVGSLQKQLLSLWERNQKDMPGYMQMLDEIAKEALANGLTHEKLGELMEGDKETMKYLFG